MKGMDFEDSRKKLMDNAHEFLELSSYKNWWSLTKEQSDIVEKIAAEFPYSIELVSGVYASHKFSEEETRDALMKRLIDTSSPNDIRRFFGVEPIEKGR